MKEKAANILNRSLDERFNLSREMLVQDDRWLTKLVDMIPAKMYFDQDVQEKITTEKHLAMNEAAEDLKRKFPNDSELSTKGKHKRARLDPLHQKSVSQVHDELGKTKRRRRKKRKGMLVPSASIERAGNIEELQKRLQERIDQLQAKRKAASNSATTTSANAVEQKRLKKKMKKMSKKKRELKIKAPDVKSTTSVVQKNNENSKPKPIYNKEKNIIYSKLDFSGEGIEETKKKGTSGKDYKSLLKKVEKKEEKIKNIKSADPEKAVIISEKEKWKKAIQKSEGIKVKDDPKLLKKALKKQQKKKNKSAKVWKERTEQTENRKKIRQEKRARNIKSRKNEKLEHKIKRSKKKGRVVLST